MWFLSPHQLIVIDAVIRRKKEKKSCVVIVADWLWGVLRPEFGGCDMFQSGCDYSRANYPAAVAPDTAPATRPRPSGVKPVPPPKPFPRPPSVRPPALPPSHVVNRRRPLTCVNDMAQNPLYMCRLSILLLFLSFFLSSAFRLIEGRTASSSL